MRYLFSLTATLLGISYYCRVASSVIIRDNHDDYSKLQQNLLDWKESVMAAADPSEVDERFLQLMEEPTSTHTEGQSYMQLCDDDDDQTTKREGSNDDNVCREGLDCQKIGAGLIMGRNKRCSINPNDNECIQSQLNEFDASYDMESYKQEILQSTGVSEMEILQMLRDSNGDTKSFLASETMQTFMNQTRITLEEPAQELWRIQKECTHAEDYYYNHNNNMEDSSLNKVRPAARNYYDYDSKQTCGGTYLGLHLEAGVIVDLSISILFLKMTNENFVATQTRICAGVEAGAGGEISFMFGTALGGTNSSDLLGMQFYGEIDGGPLLHLGLAAGASLTGIPLIEFTVGVGAGFGVGGAVCWVIDST